MQEARNLENLGYRGDVKTKMYKSVRYYYKDKSDKKVDPKKRRVYISLDGDILDSIDSHIDKNKLIYAGLGLLALTSLIVLIF